MTISNALQNGDLVLGLFLDFSKAFDTVDHDIFRAGVNSDFAIPIPIPAFSDFTIPIPIPELNNSNSNPDLQFQFQFQFRSQGGTNMPRQYIYILLLLD